MVGREFVHVPVSARDHGDQLPGFGVPAEEVDSLVAAFEGLMDGRDARVSDGVRVRRRVRVVRGCTRSSPRP